MVGISVKSVIVAVIVYIILTHIPLGLPGWLVIVATLGIAFFS